MYGRLEIVDSGMPRVIRARSPAVRRGTVSGKGEAGRAGHHAT